MRKVRGPYHALGGLRHLHRIFFIQFDDSVKVLG